MLVSKVKVIPPVIAHRGANLLAPENTLSAFKKAKEVGINWVEFDVTLSKDGEVVVIHDDTLDRTTNGSGYVYEKSLEYIKSLDAGSWFDLSFKDEKIPTLKEALLLLKKHDMHANIEIKTLEGLELELAQKVVSEINEFSGKKTNLLISSFCEKSLKHVRELSSSLPIGFLIREWRADWVQHCNAISAISVHIKEDLLTSSRVAEFKKHDVLLLAFTVNDKARFKQLKALGVDAVFSDCANELLDLDQKIQSKKKISKL